MGRQRFIGSAHEKCGTNIRYVGDGDCVYCAEVRATKYRYNELIETNSTNKDFGEIEALWHKVTHSYHMGNYAGNKTTPSKYRRMSV